jgi:hypothetical protein
MKKIFPLISFLILLSCARNPNRIISSPVPNAVPSNILWQNYGGTIASDFNINANRFPQSFELKNSFSLSGQVYSSPLIFKGNDGRQHVIVLMNSDSKLTLKKYSIVGDALGEDDAFKIKKLMFSAVGNETHHQIALGNENDQMVVFVAHDKGIDKFDARSGDTPLATYSSETPMFRLLLDGSILYAQSESKIHKLNMNLKELAEPIAINFGTPKRSLPLVISQPYLYGVGDDVIIQIDLSTFSTSNQRSYKTDHKNLYPPEWRSTKDIFKSIEIGALAAYGGGDLIYSTIAEENLSQVKIDTADNIEDLKYQQDNARNLLTETENDINEIPVANALGSYAFVHHHAFSTTRFHSFNDATSIKNGITKMNQECQGEKNFPGDAEQFPAYVNNHMGAYNGIRFATAFGDDTFTALSIVNTSFRVPGPSTTIFSNQTNACKTSGVSVDSTGITPMHDSLRPAGTTPFGTVDGYELNYSFDTDGFRKSMTSEKLEQNKKKIQQPHIRNVMDFLFPNGEEAFDLINFNKGQPSDRPYFNHLVTSYENYISEDEFNEKVKDYDSYTDAEKIYNFKYATKPSTVADVAWNFVPRFTFSSGDRYFSVVNISKNLHALPNNDTKVRHGKSWQHYLSTVSNGEITRTLTNYNSKIVVDTGEEVILPEATEIVSISAGDQLVILVGQTGSTSTLFLIK